MLGSCGVSEGGPQVVGVWCEGPCEPPRLPGQLTLPGQCPQSFSMIDTSELRHPTPRARPEPAFLSVLTSIPLPSHGPCLRVHALPIPSPQTSGLPPLLPLSQTPYSSPTHYPQDPSRPSDPLSHSQMNFLEYTSNLLPIAPNT